MNIRQLKQFLATSCTNDDATVKIAFLSDEGHFIIEDCTQLDFATRLSDNAQALIVIAEDDSTKYH